MFIQNCQNLGLPQNKDMVSIEIILHASTTSLFCSELLLEEDVPEVAQKQTESEFRMILFDFFSTRILSFSFKFQQNVVTI